MTVTNFITDYRDARNHIDGVLRELDNLRDHLEARDERIAELEDEVDRLAELAQLKGDQ